MFGLGWFWGLRSFLHHLSVLPFLQRWPGHHAHTASVLVEKKAWAWCPGHRWREGRTVWWWRKEQGNPTTHKTNQPPQPRAHRPCLHHHVVFPLCKVKHVRRERVSRKGPELTKEKHIGAGLRSSKVAKRLQKDFTSLEWPTATPQCGKIMATMQVSTQKQGIAKLQRRLHPWQVGWRSYATGCTYKSSGMLPFNNQWGAFLLLYLCVLSTLTGTSQLGPQWNTGEHCLCLTPVEAALQAAHKDLGKVMLRKASCLALSVPTTQTMQLAQAKREADQGSGGGDKATEKACWQGCYITSSRGGHLAPLSFQECAKEGAILYVLSDCRQHLRGFAWRVAKEQSTERLARNGRNKSGLEVHVLLCFPPGCQLVPCALAAGECACVGLGAPLGSAAWQVIPSAGCVGCGFLSPSCSKTRRSFWRQRWRVLYMWLFAGSSCEKGREERRKDESCCSKTFGSAKAIQVRVPNGWRRWLETSWHRSRSEKFLSF